MTWPTVALVLGVLAFVAFIAALAVHLMTTIVRKDAGAVADPAFQLRSTTFQTRPQRIS